MAYQPQKLYGKNAQGQSQTILAATEQDFKNYTGWGFTPNAPSAAPSTPAPSAPASGYNPNAQLSGYNLPTNATSTPTPTPAPVITPTKPASVVSTDQLRQSQTESAKPYIRYEGAPEVYNKTTKEWISPEKAQEIQKSDPNFWQNIEVSKTSLDSSYSKIPSPIRDIQSVFGDSWQPSSLFNQDVQQKYNIYGAVNVNGVTYSLGPGGGIETNESLGAKLGVKDSSSAIGNVDIATAQKLGINVDSSTLLGNINNGITNNDILNGFTPDMTSEDKATIAKRIRDQSNIESGVPDLQKTLNDSYNNLIVTINKHQSDEATALSQEATTLNLEAKNTAISNAETAYTQVKGKYDEFINNIRFSKAPMEILLGQKAKAMSEQAITLAPLAAAIQISQNAYGRAKEIYDQFSETYDKNFQYQIDAAKLNILKIEGNLTTQQEQAKEDATQKLQFYIDDYNQSLADRQEVQKLALLYPSASIKISDNFDMALSKASPYITDIQDLEKRSQELDVKLKEYQLGKPYYAPATGLGDVTEDSIPINNWVKLIQTGQAKLTDIKTQGVRDQVANALANSGQLVIDDKDREKLSTLDTAFNVANTIKDLSSRINTFDETGRITGYAERHASILFQSNSEMARYNAAREGFVSNVARTLGEKGALAEGDVQRAMSNLPTVDDTKAVAEGKLQTLFSILNGAKNSIIEKSTKPLIQLNTGTINQSNSNDDPMGIR